MKNATVKEFAAKVGRSEVTVYAWAKRGKIKTSKIGGRLVVTDAQGVKPQMRGSDAVKAGKVVKSCIGHLSTYDSNALNARISSIVKRAESYSRNFSLAVTDLAEEFRITHFAVRARFHKVINAKTAARKARKKLRAANAQVHKLFNS